MKYREKVTVRLASELRSLSLYYIPQLLLLLLDCDVLSFESMRVLAVHERLGRVIGHDKQSGCFRRRAHKAKDVGKGKTNPSETCCN